MHKFSIIIPVYNVTQYLRECLDSVLAQTCGDWECVCVDDGSTDGSLDILREYAARDLRFSIVEQGNAGASVARNRGISLAQGDYFCFVDADDVVHPSLLRYYEVASDKSPDLIMAGSACFRDGDQPQWRRISEVFTDLQVDEVRRSVRASHVMRQACGAVAYKRAVCGTVRFQPYSMGEDFLFLTECLMAADRVVSTGVNLYAYRQREGSVCHSCFDLKKVEGFCHAMYETLCKMTGSEKVFSRDVVRRMYLNLVEKIPFLMLSLPTVDRKIAFRLWRKHVLELADRDFHCKMAMLVSRVAAWMGDARLGCRMCALPYRLKAAGLHR